MNNVLGFKHEDFAIKGYSSNAALTSLVNITIFRLDKEGKARVSIKSYGRDVKALHDVEFTTFVQAANAINTYAIASAMQTIQMSRLRNDKSDYADEFVLPFFNTRVYKMQRDGKMLLYSDIGSVPVNETILQAEEEMLKLFRYYLTNAIGLLDENEYSQKELWDVCRCTKTFVDDLFDGSVFVFGSNGQGKHVGGAALFAHTRADYPWGVSRGLCINKERTCGAYGIETLTDLAGERTEFDDLVNSFIGLIDCAKKHPHLKFILTEVGCGIAGRSSKQVAYAFYLAMKGEAKIYALNISIPINWVSYLYSLPY
jgi:hypothetical protein